jgi:1-acyl-sn-glycerol-3-phosphate acyltransferase
MLLQAVTRSVLAPLARAVARPVVEGRENVPRKGPVILAANHLSVMDSFAIPLLSPRPVAFLAKAEYFEGLGLSGYLVQKVMTAVDAMPVPRGQHRAAQAALDTALEALRQGKAFGIHPEGSRSRDGRLYRGRTGVAWLALASGAPVVPVGLIGTDRMQPVGARLPRPVRVTIRFGTPRYFKPDDAIPVARQRRQITDEIMAAIQELSGQQEAHEYNELSAG